MMKGTLFTRLTRPAALALGLGLSSGAALAEEVTIQSFDGGISITGELVSVEGSTATIDSAVGRLQVNLLEMRCIGDACPQQAAVTGEVSIAGAKSVLTKVMPALVTGYAVSRLDATAQTEAMNDMTKVVIQTETTGQLATIDIVPTNSETGFAKLKSGEADIIVSGRPASSDERSTAAKEKVLALDGILVLAHPSNPVRVVGKSDLPAIFSGRTSKWSDLGGFDADIKIYAQAGDAASIELFNALVMEPAGASFDADITILDSDAAVAEAVARDPFGIGIGTFSAQRGARPMIIRGACGVQTPANEFTIRTEDYPLTQRIYLYSGSAELDAYAADLEDFALSDEGQFLLSTGGYVDQRVSSERIDSQGIRLASAMMENGADGSFRDLRRMMTNLVAGERMSLTFRFEFGSTTLDSRALGDVERLATLLSTGDFQNKDVYLVGFADSLGDAGKNLALSQTRAQVVREALFRAAPAGSLDNIRISADGYGELAPIVCNDTEAERATNRRVEVWVSDRVGG